MKERSVLSTASTNHLTFNNVLGSTWHLFQFLCQTVTESSQERQQPHNYKGSSSFLLCNYPFIDAQTLLDIRWCMCPVSCKTKKTAPRHVVSKTKRNPHHDISKQFVGLHSLLVHLILDWMSRTLETLVKVQSINIRNLLDVNRNCQFGLSYGSVILIEHAFNLQSQPWQSAPSQPFCQTWDHSYSSREHPWDYSPSESVTKMS